MSKTCSQCHLETNDEDDLHCRRILKIEIERLLAEGELEKAEIIINQTVFEDQKSESWKFVMFNHLSENLRMIREKENKRQADERHKKVEQKIRVELEIILNKLNQNINLNKNDLLLLEYNKKYNELANYYLQLFKKTSDLWYLSSASKNYRMAGKPTEAINITNNIPDGDLCANAAVLTSRGASFKDLGMFNQAIECANKAIKKTPTYYSYSLLGAIHMEMFNFEEGIKCFDYAKQLGASSYSKDNEIKKILVKSNQETRNKIADYLLSIDQSKYGWVNDI